MRVTTTRDKRALPQGPDRITGNAYDVPMPDDAELGVNAAAERVARAFSAECLALLVARLVEGQAIDASPPVDPALMGYALGLGLSEPDAYALGLAVETLCWLFDEPGIGGGAPLAHKCALLRVAAQDERGLVARWAFLGAPSIASPAVPLSVHRCGA